MPEETKTVSSARRLVHIVKRPVVRDIIILTIAVLVLTLPFVNEAFHWDDRDFVSDAQVSAQDPLQFQQFDFPSRGHIYAHFPFRHPPFLSLYLSLFIRLAGGVSEVVFHLAYLVFPLMAVLSIYALARRFTRHPLIAGLLFAFSPGILIMSHTVMGNVPGVAFWLLGTALFVWGVDRDRWLWFILGGIAMGMTFLTVAQAISLLPIVFFYAIVRRYFRLRMFAALAIALAVYLGWRYYFISYYGKAPATSYGVSFTHAIELRSLLAFLGGAIIFAPAIIALFVRKKIDLLVAFVTLPPVVTLTVLYPLSQGDITLAQGLFLAVLVSAGFLLFYKMFYGAVVDAITWFRKRGARGGERTFLLAWVLGVLAIYIGSSISYVAVRHLLPLYAPVIIFFVMEAEQMWPMKPRLRTGFIAATLLLTLAIGLAGAIADYRLANTERAEAQKLGQELAGTPGKKWFLGEFGFRYYMEQQGFEYLSAESVASPGDIVVRSEVDASGVVGSLPEGYYDVLSTDQVQDWFPVRTMNPWAGAGFYGDPMGPLPLAASNAPVDEFTVNRLKW